MELSEILKSKKIIGVTGPSCSGKTLFTFLSKNIFPYDFKTLSIDDHVIGDSLYREKDLQLKRNISIYDYSVACNQYNWYNWHTVLQNIKSIKLSKESDKLFVDGSILGNPDILDFLDCIIFLHREDINRLPSFIEKNNFPLIDALKYFLISEYSSNLYYKHFLLDYKKDIIVIDKNYEIISTGIESFLKKENNILPVPF